ncbi:hypothetical protein [Cellulomonas sp. SLBN-39]|uniref:hypothetical protein n=1 Tax=Cellulomonas sp. SLBN-39 TaxID=2768446 RepID=UPI00115132E1|nr:hypothetical protein [Cellulomonas sp. SLBN-39]TQL02613.1 hypothetical protein FBY24_1693 [Cellulomonas sp. SLBN-39]
MSIALRAMGDAQRQAWLAILDLHDRYPTGWTIVGGQMVHLWCAERGTAPTRPTDDLDAVLDVRAEPNALLTFTTALRDMGFRPEGETWNGHQHRWVRDNAQIDVLIPRHLGGRAAGRKGVSGGTTLETPGAQQALRRSRDVTVTVGDRDGMVRRPSLLGALVAKAAANTVSLDPARRRHVLDFLVLTTLIEPEDHVEAADARDRRYLAGMLATIGDDRRAVLTVDGAEDGLAALRTALDT